MIGFAQFFGRARKVTSFASVAPLHPEIARVWVLEPSAPGGVARLPDPVFTCPHIREGGPHVYATNIGTDDVEIQQPDGTTISDLPAGSSLLAWLVDRNGTAPWRIEIRAVQ